MGMQVVNQTDIAINALPLGSGTHLIRPRSKADSIRGFMIVCNAASASFVIQRKLKRIVNGKQKSVRVGLGVRGEITLDDAMGKARAALENINKGLDPNAIRRAAREEESNRLTLRSAYAPAVFRNSRMLDLVAGGELIDHLTVQESRAA